MIKCLKWIIHKIRMHVEEKRYVKAKTNERLHGRVVKKAGQ